MKKLDINIQNVSKIEGHADLDVKVRNGKVEEVKLGFTENKRFFSQAIQGRSIDTLPQSVSRICGTCSIAHLLCCIEAIEKALGIIPTNQSKILKRLTYHGLMIRDHALHLYLFSLPDVLNKDSVLDFDEYETTFLKEAFDVKRVGNNITKIVAGRAIHAPYPMVGGFAQIPDNEALKKLIPDLQNARKKILRLIELYYNCKVDYTRETTFVALCADNFSFLEGEIRSNVGLSLPEKDFGTHLHKTVIPYSQAVGYKFRGKTHMVGSLARLNLNKQALHPTTQADCEKYLKVFPSNNIFRNNLAQAIETLHCIDDSIDLIRNNTFHHEEPTPVKPKACSGTGVIEAPRGTLYYHLDIKADGTIKEGAIVVPSQQNQINMELDIKKIVQDNLDKLPKEDIEYAIEKLIRAYDPCISCASHFLKVKWDVA